VVLPLCTMVEPASDRDELYAKCVAVPEHQCAEIVNGTLYVTPHPTPSRSYTISTLCAEVGGPFQVGRDGPGGWWILRRIELQLDPKQPLVPDVAGWTLARMPELPETDWLTLVPDWVCEVLSRSTERLDRDEKLPFYAKHGVRHVWLVDPVGQHLEVYTLDPGTRRWSEVRIYPGHTTVRAAPFGAIELNLGLLWSLPRRIAP